MKKLPFVLVLVAILASLALPIRDVRAAQPCAVPQSWGQVRTMALGQYGQPLLAFEDERGTVRIIPAECKTPPNPVYTVIRYPG